MTFLSTLRTWWTSQKPVEELIPKHLHEYKLESALLAEKLNHIKEKKEILQEQLRTIREIQASYLKEQSLT